MNALRKSSRQPEYSVLMHGVKLPLLLKVPGVYPEAHIVARNKNDFGVWVVVLFIVSERRFFFDRCIVLRTGIVCGHDAVLRRQSATSSDVGFDSTYFASLIY